MELRALDGRTGWLLAWAPRLAGEIASGTADAVIALFAGLFIALQPDHYLRGFLRLFPVRRRPQAEAVFLACGTALRQWLVGQASAMAFVGLGAGLALWLAGVRAPLGLGLLASLGQVVPLVGPFVAAAPGVLLALSDSPEKALWAALIYLAVGQIKANLFSPLIMRQMVKLPMAVTLLAVLAFGTLLGPMGVVLATPLAVIIFVLVTKLYVEGLLEDAPVAEARASPPLSQSG
jgi:predicted PurR-regulated permease PerM